MADDKNTNAEFEEYIIFTVTDKEGNDVEMAVVDEFEFEKKPYVVAALVEDDSINEESCFIYKVKATEEFAVEKIKNQIDYEKVAKAYMEMEDEAI